MFVNETLSNHLKTSPTIRTESLVLAEWNLNDLDNVHKLGNYRFRPTEIGSEYSSITNSFDDNDSGNFYTNATDSDIVVDGGIGTDSDGNTVPVLFQSKKLKENLLYSLESCIDKFRPRSGINKLRYFEDKFTHYSNSSLSQRPRYYMADKTDKFKYWTSYRLEEGIERGVSNKTLNFSNYIDDAAPFVVYKTEIPANRIIVKMQTNVGTVDLGPFSTVGGSLEDPFFGTENGSIPATWKIQYLLEDDWVDAVSFRPSSKRRDGTSIVRPDGNVEISYGLILPEEFSDNFTFIGEYSSADLLPEVSTIGHAYLVKQNFDEAGFYMVWNGVAYSRVPANYDWHLSEESLSGTTSLVNNLVSPERYVSPLDGSLNYREFAFIKGIRVVVESMNTNNSTFDLIEMSPRLVVDMTDKVSDFSIVKHASDLGLSGLPVGQLLASTGSLSIFDYDESFNKQNSNSIIAKHITQNIKFTFYDKIIDVKGYDYYVPLKTLYSEAFPEISNAERTVQITLRDLFFMLETSTAPQLFLQDVSFSFAVSTLLDYVGFSNYVFKRNPGESELVIPAFYTGTDSSLAETLQSLAISAQASMFFDEYNNLVIMSKGYTMPQRSERPTDLTIYGTQDFADLGVIENNQLLQADETKNLANIIGVSSQESLAYNDGEIIYTSRYIQRERGSITQLEKIDKYQTWIYKPVLLWEAGGTESTRPINNEFGNQGSYTLSAVPLNTSLTLATPSVAANFVVDNIMDFGDSSNSMSRYNGYFYANGEIIRYDAVEYSVSGVGSVWISSGREYSQYLSKLPFNGKIYSTGRVRIYSRPEYESVGGVRRLKPGPIVEHGRGQFGTDVVNHSVGIPQNSHWANNENVRGCTMLSSYLFDAKLSTDSIVLTQEASGQSNELAIKTTRNSIIRNFQSSSYIGETDVTNQYTATPGTIQSSALVMSGPTFTTSEKPRNFISYVFKPLTNKFKYFGTRVRLVGKINNSQEASQSAVGSSTYYESYTNTSGANPAQESLQVSGSSGGMAIMVNPQTNVGYYFEIIALSENNTGASDSSEIHNVIFYKINKDQASDSSLSPSVPTKLWGGLTSIVVDNGLFTGQARMAGEEIPTVYDLGIEYEDIGNSRKFSLYINDQLVQTVVDSNPLNVYNNMALFVRGASRAMFENVFAITNSYSQNTTYSLDAPVSSAFGYQNTTTADSFKKYALSGIVQQTYLSGLSSSEPPKYSLYFEEFGTIMREAAYLNVRYDKAFPALYAKISPTLNDIKGYVVSGFISGAYGAEFLIFNSTDTILTLDPESGNFLRIQGVAFTDESNNELTVDDYFSKRSDFSKPKYSGSNLVSFPTKAKEDYLDLKASRVSYGRKSFSLNVEYVQTEDEANNLMAWVTSKIMKPRKSVGVEVFGMPIIQLGDIVEISYRGPDGTQQISPEGTRFIVYSIDYNRNSDGPSMTIFLSEVS